MGRTGVIADSANNLLEVLEEHQFVRTARSLFAKELEGYDRFGEMLKFMAELKCVTVCREREDNSITCPIRKCCKERGFYACYECDGFENCDKLRSFMNGLHTVSCLKNLKAIKEMGLEDWIMRGKKNWYWCEGDGRP
jgi:hypothetical protein